MDPVYSDLSHLIALTMGVAWASGINLYAAVLMLGLLGATGHMVMPPGFDPLMHPLVISAAGFMYCAEFFADKVPGVDTGWDVLHTFVRIPAGAVLAATAVGDVSIAAQIAAALVGGTVSAGAHLTKASARVLINTSPEPVSNWTMSVAEDIAVVAGLWTALQYPVLFLVLLALFIMAAIWMLPRLWRGVERVGAAIGRWIRSPAGAASAPGVEPAPDQPQPQPGSTGQAPALSGRYETLRHHQPDRR